MKCLRMYLSENSNPKTLANFEIFYSSAMNAPLHKQKKFKIVTITQSKSQLITTDSTITQSKSNILIFRMAKLDLDTDGDGKMFISC